MGEEEGKRGEAAEGEGEREGEEEGDRVEVGEELLIKG